MSVSLIYTNLLNLHLKPHGKLLPGICFAAYSTCLFLVMICIVGKLFCMICLITPAGFRMRINDSDVQFQRISKHLLNHPALYQNDFHFTGKTVITHNQS